ncbi:MAG: hypothetical protein PHF18_02395 [Methanosarcina sp.]|uniref:hypothetical protein n=1 Tax=Methanosarcina sp. TaxID=2213 RepID=UPI00262B11DB|nr:hypothetical protein [Methanosarcina sp.]MDD3245710.1 hypothetical protein [Methanosarcina sp.]
MEISRSQVAVSDRKFNRNIPVPGSLIFRCSYFQVLLFSGTLIFRFSLINGVL